jgi:hypothetical protein
MKPARRHFYRHGKAKVYLEHVAGALAIKYKGSPKQLLKILSAFGRVREVAPQQLLVVELAASSAEADLRRRLEPMVDKGVVESILPVLRDKESGLLQVLTDEITVRFKPELDLKKRRALEKKFGLTSARRNEFVPNQYVVKTRGSRGLDTLHLANELDADDEVEFAAPNFVSEHQR